VVTGLFDDDDGYKAMKKLLALSPCPMAWSVTTIPLPLAL
jgi:hypothetical protein